MSRSRMSTFHQQDDKTIETKGLWLFGGLSGVLVLGKLLGCGSAPGGAWLYRF